jgi:hypothetical protein
LFWTAMSGVVHAFALARAENIAATELAPYARGIGQLLPDFITGLAQQIDNGVYPGDGSNITSAAAGMDHIIHAADSHGIDADVLRAGRAIAQRAIDAGHGNDGFARLTAMLTD